VPTVFVGNPGLVRGVEQTVRIDRTWVDMYGRPLPPPAPPGFMVMDHVRMISGDSGYGVFQNGKLVAVNFSPASAILVGPIDINRISASPAPPEPPTVEPS